MKFFLLQLNSDLPGKLSYKRPSILSQIFQKAFDDWIGILFDQTNDAQKETMRINVILQLTCQQVIDFGNVNPFCQMANHR